MRSAKNRVTASPVSWLLSVVAVRPPDLVHWGYFSKKYDQYVVHLVAGGGGVPTPLWMLSWPLWWCFFWAMVLDPSIYCLHRNSTNARWTHMTWRSHDNPGTITTTTTIAGQTQEYYSRTIAWQSRRSQEDCMTIAVQRLQNRTRTTHRTIAGQ